MSEETAVPRPDVVSETVEGIGEAGAAATLPDGAGDTASGGASEDSPTSEAGESRPVAMGGFAEQRAAESSEYDEGRTGGSLPTLDADSDVPDRRGI
jgi:hypothetical protein